jgi:hypothetical protein
MLHRAIRFLPLILIGLITGAQTQPTTPIISLAMHYTQARARMIEAGFAPFRVIPPDSDLFKRNFAGREDIPRKFPEAAQCRPNGKSPCYFLFVRGPDEIVAITAVGAHPETLIVRKVHVATPAEAEALYSANLLSGPDRSPQRRP